MTSESLMKEQTENRSSKGSINRNKKITSSSSLLSSSTLQRSSSKITSHRHPGLTRFVSSMIRKYHRRPVEVLGMLCCASMLFLGFIVTVSSTTTKNTLGPVSAAAGYRDSYAAMAPSSSPPHLTSSSKARIHSQQRQQQTEEFEAHQEKTSSTMKMKKSSLGAAESVAKSSTTLGERVVKRLQEQQQEQLENEHDDTNKGKMTKPMLVHNGEIEVILGRTKDETTIFAKKVEGLLETIGNDNSDNKGDDTEGSGQGRWGYIEEKSINIKNIPDDKDANQQSNENPIICGTYGCNRRYERQPREEDSSTLTMKLRIQSQYFAPFIRAIELMVDETNKKKENGSKEETTKQYFNWTISNIDTSTKDVTNDYVDAVARASVINQSRQAIQAILSEATNISDVMRIQNELNRLTEDYESQKQRSIALQNLSQLSTLIIKTRIRPPEPIKMKPLESIQESRWNPFRSMSRAIDDVMDMFKEFYEAISYIAVWLVLVFAPVGISLWVFVKYCIVPSSLYQSLHDGYVEAMKENEQEHFSTAGAGSPPVYSMSTPPPPPPTTSSSSCNPNLQFRHHSNQQKASINVDSSKDSSIYA